MAGRISYLGGIVTQGLVLDLDAAKRDSYPGTGTAWNDISGNANNGTLINGPTFNSGNGGSITFDGSNNYATFSNTNSLLLNQGSVSVWTKSSTPNPNQFIYNGIIVKQNNFGIFTLNSTLVTYDWGNNTGRGTGINIVDGVWRNIVLTFTDNTGTLSNNCNFYVNGVNVLTTTIKISNNNVGLQIGNGGPAQNQYYNGSIGMSQIYNRALTATEVLQNYNATKGRYL